MKRKVAFIGTGGTISSVGKGPLDITDYGANKMMLEADGILSAFADVQTVAEVIPVPYMAIPSTAI